MPSPPRQVPVVVVSGQAQPRSQYVSSRFLHCLRCPRLTKTGPWVRQFASWQGKRRVSHQSLCFSKIRGSRDVGLQCGYLSDHFGVERTRDLHTVTADDIYLEVAPRRHRVGEPRVGRLPRDLGQHTFQKRAAHLGLGRTDRCHSAVRRASRQCRAEPKL